jgi:hypothetical protein
LKQQVAWAYKGLKHANNALPLLRLYQERKMMATLGIMSSDDEVSSWELTAFIVIDGELNKLQELERKKHAARRNH